MHKYCLRFWCFWHRKRSLVNHYDCKRWRFYRKIWMVGIDPSTWTRRSENAAFTGAEWQLPDLLLGKPCTQPGYVTLSQMAILGLNLEIATLLTDNPSDADVHCLIWATSPQFCFGSQVGLSAARSASLRCRSALDLSPLRPMAPPSSSSRIASPSPSSSSGRISTEFRSFLQLRSQGLEPNVFHGTNFLVRAAWQQSLGMVTWMQQQGIPLDPISFNALAAACRPAWQRAVLTAAAESPGLSALIDGCGSDGSWRLDPWDDGGMWIFSCEFQVFDVDSIYIYMYISQFLIYGS